MHFYILTLPGGHFKEKNSKKIQSFRGCGEKMTITRFILRLAPKNHLHSIENQILVKIKLKWDTGFKDIEQSSIFLATLVKIPAFFNFFGLKRVKCLTFNI